MSEFVDCAQCGADDFETVYRHPSGGVAHGACRRCGLGYLSPRPDAAATTRLYDGYRQAYPDAFLAATDGPFGRAAAARAAFLDRWLRPGARILEVGCGYGHFLHAARAAGYRVEGLEPSQHQVQFARERLGLTSVERGLLDDVARDGRQDLVAMFHVIEHLRDPQAALQLLAQAVRPGGLVWLELPNALRLPCDAIEHHYIVAGHHLHTFTPRVLAAMAARAGFETLYLAEDPLPAVYEANLRFVGRRVAAAATPPPRRPAETLRSLTAHHRRLAALGARVSGKVQRWRAVGRRIALYGAGFHTRGLVDLCAFGAHEIDCILDDDRTKHGTELAGFPVCAPDSLHERRIDAVLVSSLAAETAIVDRLRAQAPRGCVVNGIYGTGPRRPSAAARGPRLEVR